MHISVAQFVVLVVYMIPLRKPSAFHLLDSCLECICLGLVVFLQIEEPIVWTSFAVLADQFLLSMAVPLLTLYLGLIWSWQDNWAVVAAAVVVQECHGVGWYCGLFLQAAGFAYDSAVVGFHQDDSYDCYHILLVVTRYCFLYYRRDPPLLC